MSPHLHHTYSYSSSPFRNASAVWTSIPTYAMAPSSVSVWLAFRCSSKFIRPSVSINSSYLPDYAAHSFSLWFFTGCQFAIIRRDAVVQPDDCPDTGDKHAPFGGLLAHLEACVPHRVLVLYWLGPLQSDMLHLTSPLNKYSRHVILPSLIL